MELRFLALSTAQKELGKGEQPKGSNWGPVVEAYLGSVGIGFAAAWCQAFVYWCFQQAASINIVPNPVIRTGGVMECWRKSTNKLSKAQAIANPSLVLPGYQFVLDLGKGLGHTGFVETVGAGGVLHTIEGNSNEDGSREGYEVVRHTRKLSDKALIGFIKY